MPNRSKQHVSADQGVAEIARILTHSGWACEAVKADYGEDLICQTSYDGAVDPHRILVQVKSTHRKLTRRNAHISIKRGTLLKWLSDSNLVVVCLWSTADKSALYRIPSDQFSLFSVDLSTEKLFRLEFPIENRLDQVAIENVVWRSRLRNISRHYLEKKNALESLTRDQFQSGAEFERGKYELQQDMGSILTKFLIYIGLVRLIDNRVIVDTRAFIYEMLHFGAVAKNRHELKKLKLELESVVLLTVLLRAARTISKVGLPVALLEAASQFYLAHIVELIKKSNQDQKVLSPKRLRNQVASLAKRLWTFGAVFSPQQIAELVDRDDIRMIAGLPRQAQANAQA